MAKFLLAISNDVKSVVVLLFAIGFHESAIWGISIFGGRKGERGLTVWYSSPLVVAIMMKARRCGVQRDAVFVLLAEFGMWVIGQTPRKRVQRRRSRVQRIYKAKREELRSQPGLVLANGTWGKNLERVVENELCMCVLCA